MLDTEVSHTLSAQTYRQTSMICPKVVVWLSLSYIYFRMKVGKADFLVYHILVLVEVCFSCRIISKAMQESFCACNLENFKLELFHPVLFQNQELQNFVLQIDRTRINEARGFSR